MVISKLLAYLKEHGSEATAEWYARELEMPIKNAQYMIAYRVFKECYEDDEFDDSVIDITLCRYLWQKYVGDKEIAEMIEEVLTMNKFKRKEGLQDRLYDLNIEYPKSDRVIDAIYYAVPMLRTASSENVESVIRFVYKQLSVRRVTTPKISNKKKESYKYNEDFHEGGMDDERYEEGSPSEEWYNYYDDGM